MEENNRKITVSKDVCIGCGLCVSEAEKFFKFDDNGLSEPTDEVVTDENVKEVLAVVEACPMGAIVVE